VEKAYATGLFRVAYLRDQLTPGTIEVWFHTGKNHPMIQQRRLFLVVLHEVGLYVGMIFYFEFPQ
jgi:hypothetical protein